jgi:hypothetical protein
MKYLVALTLGFALMMSVMSFKKAYPAVANSFVQMLERREGMAPGGTKVIPDCSCTMQYLGTQVRGRDYFVHLRKLD